MASKTFNPGRRAFARKLIDWENDDIRALLLKDTYVFNADHEFVSDLVAHELTATDYVRKQLTGRSVGTGSPTYFIADSPVWVGLGGGVNQDVAAIIVFLHTGNDATARLIAQPDFTNQPTQDIDFEVTFGNNRVMTWSDA